MSNTPIFSKLFGRSPISPIQEHMVTCEKCAEELIPYFEAVLEEDWVRAEATADKISEIENAADSQKKSIRLNLPRSLFLPVGRNDLLEIVQVQDRIANLSKDIAGTILGRRMNFPIQTRELLTNYILASVKAVCLAREAMDELNDLVVKSFSGQEIEFIEKILDRLDHAEYESDLRQRELRHKLYEIETTLNPVDAMFIYKVVDLIGEVADDAQTMGNRMMYLIAS